MYKLLPHGTIRIHALRMTIQLSSVEFRDLKTYRVVEERSYGITGKLWGECKIYALTVNNVRTGRIKGPRMSGRWGQIGERSLHRIFIVYFYC